jgi:H+/Cl- antiporter ClcA
MVSATSVMFAKLTGDLLCSFLPIHAEIFPGLSLSALSPRDVWIPFVVGIAVGVFAVLFLKYYYVIRGFSQRLIKGKMADVLLIFSIFVLTVLFGLASDSFISTGHDLMLSLFDGKRAVYVLLLILLVQLKILLFLYRVKIRCVS